LWSLDVVKNFAGAPVVVFARPRHNGWAGVGLWDRAA
jgi:hypothetical protein